MVGCLAQMVRDWNGSVDMTTTTGGIDAMRHCQEHPIDLVITDVHMPEINGIRLLRMLRNRPEGECPLVAFVSGAFVESDPLIQLAHPDFFLAKPVQAARFREMLDEVVRRLGGTVAGAN